MRLKLLITNIVFFILLLSAMVVMSIQAPQYFNRLSQYLKNSHHAPQINDPRYGGTLVWGTINPPTIINPVLTSHSVSSSLLALIFDSLIRIDSKGNIIPDLAQSWDVSKDGLQYTFYLHPHIYFHDGVECTAQDVKFTYEAIQDPLNQSHWREGTELVSRWDVIDRYTIRIILKKPFSGLLFKLTREILPKHLYEHTNISENPHNYSPVGTGPFYFVSWDRPSNEITLKTNKNYFEGRPFLDKIVIKVYQDNSSLWAALMRGEVDFVKFLNQKDYEVLSKDPAFKTFKFPSGFYFAIIYNLNNPILNDRQLRHALSYAVDRKALMLAVGIDGVESNGPFYTQSPWFNKNIEPVSYNPIKAQSILTSQGWGLNKDGILKKAGQALVLTMLVNKNRPDFLHMAMVLRQQFSEVGIDLKIVYYDDESQLTKTYLRRIKPQMWLRIFGTTNDDPEDKVYNWYSSSSEFGHFWTYRNKGIDRLFEKILSIKDEKQRIEDFQKIDALISEDQPACFLFFPIIYSAVSSQVANTDKFFNDNMPDYLIKQWIIANGRG